MNDDDRGQEQRVPTPLPTSEPSEGEAQPYRLVGLILSLAAILALTALACLILAGIAFALSSLVLGWRETLDRFVDLDPSGGRDEVFREKLAVLVSLGLYAAMSAAILVMARWRGRARWRDLVAWRPWSPLHDALWFWGLVVLVLVYSLAANAAIAYFYPAFDQLVRMPTGGRWVVLFVALAALAAPVTEELLFRGWIFTSLRTMVGAWPVILATSILFAIAHWESTHLYALAVFPVGLALGFVRERTGSIKATMTFHAVYNGIASILLFLAR